MQEGGIHTEYGSLTELKSQDWSLVRLGQLEVVMRSRVEVFQKSAEDPCESLAE